MSQSALTVTTPSPTPYHASGRSPIEPLRDAPGGTSTVHISGDVDVDQMLTDIGNLASTC